MMLRAARRLVRQMLLGRCMLIPPEGRITMRLLVTSCSLLLTAGLAVAGHPKISKDLEKVDHNANVDVIVQFTSAPQQSHLDKVKRRGGAVRNVLGSVQGGAFRMPANQLQELANDPEV